MHWISTAARTSLCSCVLPCMSCTKWQSTQCMPFSRWMSMQVDRHAVRPVRCLGQQIGRAGYGPSGWPGTCRGRDRRRQLGRRHVRDDVAVVVEQIALAVLS